MIWIDYSWKASLKSTTSNNHIGNDHQLIINLPSMPFDSSDMKLRKLVTPSPRCLQ